MTRSMIGRGAEKGTYLRDIGDKASALGRRAAEAPTKDLRARRQGGLFLTASAVKPAQLSRSSA